MPQAVFDPPGEKWQLCLNIVVALPPKPPRLGTLPLFTPISLNNIYHLCALLSGCETQKVGLPRGHNRMGPASPSPQGVDPNYAQGET